MPELKPLSKDGITRTPGTPTERVQLLASGWTEAKQSKKPTDPKP